MRQLMDSVIGAWLLNTVPAREFFHGVYSVNIHEYQAKSLLDRYNVLTPGGRVASSPEEAKACALALGGQRWAV